MSIEKINAVRYKCTCEAVDNEGVVCGYQWESDSIPARCAKCKRPTWNHLPLRHGRNGKQIVAFGKSQTMAQWAREYKFNRVTLLFRVKNGWPVEEAIRTPVHKRLEAEVREG